MRSIDECYKKVKNDCFKFINLQETKTNKLGMWSMTFKYPWDFRKGL